MLVTASLLAGGSAGCELFGDTSLVQLNVYASHHGRRDQTGEIPDYGLPESKRTFVNDLGWEINVSDGYFVITGATLIACDGAQHEIHMPRGPLPEWVNAADRDVTIIGGDITGARQLTISITAIGEALEEELAYRKGAEPGDVLCVTGDLGSAYAGLKVLLRERAELQEKKEEFVPTIRQYQYVVNRNLAPVARLGVIQSWREAGFRPHAMIDVSDGLASEVNHLCRRSGCGAIVRASDIPLHEQTHRVATEFGESPTLYQLQGGEDYELLFAAPESELKKLKDSSYAVIGEFVAREEGVVLQHADGTEEELKPIGWDHFA